ncbi:MAG: response regulator [Flavobacteriales bacterium]|nr:response regulator [Flavobacteriales bacterium]
MIKALLVDDEPQLRTYLRSLLEEACADIQVIGEASNIEEAKKLIAQHDPQLVFLDIEMAGGSGFDLLRDLEALEL